MFIDVAIGRREIAFLHPDALVLEVRQRMLGKSIQQRGETGIIGGQHCID